MGKRGRKPIGTALFTTLSDDDKAFVEALAQQHASSVSAALRYIVQQYRARLVDTATAPQ